MGSLPDSLGGKGGYNGGHFGRSDEWSGGGGGGGLTTVSWNGTVIAAAYGGDGGGNTTYCTAEGGVGASLRGRPKDTGGYIDLGLALNATDDLQEENMCPGRPAIVTLTHDSAQFAWNVGTHRNNVSKDLYVHRYTVNLSEQDRDGLVDDSDPTKGLIPPCEGEFNLHGHIQSNYDITKNVTTVVTGLKASTNHCVRIEAFSIEGLSLGVRFLPFRTKAVPVNRWHSLMVREPRVATFSKDIVKKDEGEGSSAATLTSSSCQNSSMRPTGRRGHSVTIIHDQVDKVYIFGGATWKCSCELLDADHGDAATFQHLQETEGNRRRCTTKNVYSNELWHFDPLTAMFTQFKRKDPAELWPRGREQHSATALPNGDIIVIGGLSAADGGDGGGEPEIAREDSTSGLLADVWRMRDPYHVSSHVFHGSGSGGALPMELTPGHITSHRLAIALDDDDEGDTVDEDKKMCVCDTQLFISLSGCLKGIEYIKLTGPGTKDVNDHDAPQSGEYETKVMSSSLCT